MRNALIALMHVDLQRALNYVRSQLDNLAIWSTHLQLAALEVIRKVKVQKYFIFSKPLSVLCYQPKTN